MEKVFAGALEVDTGVVRHGAIAFAGKLFVCPEAALGIGCNGIGRVKQANHGAASDIPGDYAIANAAHHIHNIDGPKLRCGCLSDDVADFNQHFLQGGIAAGGAPKALNALTIGADMIKVVLDELKVFAAAGKGEQVS